MDDNKIVELYLNRDERAIEATDEKYNAYLTKIAYNILANDEDSKESVNDTYLAAWDSIPPHRPSVLRTYLAKLTRRISIDAFRRRNRDKRRESCYAESLNELEGMLSCGNSLDDTVDGHLLTDAIEKFLRALPSYERQVFVSRYYFCDPLSDVAVYCGGSVSKIKSTLYRTRNKLKTYLEEEGFYL